MVRFMHKARAGHLFSLPALPPARAAIKEADVTLPDGSPLPVGNGLAFYCGNCLQGVAHGTAWEPEGGWPAGTEPLTRG